MFRIFHVSDLHIDEELVPKRHLIAGLEGHNIEIWAAFREHFLQRLQRPAEDYRVAITGDLSAKGSKRSLLLARHLIFESESDVAEQVGLKLPPEKVILIPGNHDSFESKLVGPNRLHYFKEIFHVFDEYPITSTFQMDGVRLTVIGFESAYLGNSYTPAKKLGRGVIEDSQYRAAEAYLRERETDIRIVCLHHNPIFPPNVKRDWNLVLEDSYVFLEWIIKNKIDIVMFGHIHDDFYDVLPLSSLLRLLPKRRGWRARIRRLFKLSNPLMEFEPIDIRGELVRQIDAIAYGYIRAKRPETLDYKTFDSKLEFEEYLHAIPDYEEFFSDLKRFSATETMLVMTGSVCQQSDERKNSYIELEFFLDKQRIALHRHKYQPTSREFQTKTTLLPLPIQFLPGPEAGSQRELPYREG